MIGRLYIVPSCLIGLVLLSIAGSAADPRKEAKVSFRGKLGSYDPERNTLVAIEGSKSVTFLVQKDIKILIDKAPTDHKLKDIPEDAFIALVLSEDKTTIVELHVEGPTAYGTVEAINLKDQTIQIKSKKGLETFSLVEDVIIKVDKVYSKLDAARLGMHASLKITSDRKKIVTMALVTPKSE